MDMSWQRVCLAVGLFGVLLLLTNADNSVHILSKYQQLVTSTALNWLPRAYYDSSKEIVIGGFAIEESEDNSFNNQAEKSERRRPLYVCRVLHTAVWVAGTQKGDDQRCTVTIHGNVQSYDKYDLLENVDSAARVNWEHWDKYKNTPVGAVAMEKMFIARHPAKTDKNTSSPRYTHYIGTLNKRILGSISYVKDDGTEETAKDGDVLVETEPTSYDLENVKLNWPKMRVVNRTSLELDNATIINDGTENATIAKAFGYKYKYSIYWGQGHAILKGLNTLIKLTNGTALSNIMWGTKETSNNTDIYTVKINLLPGTGINVSLVANYTSMEVPYSGKLISHYEDGETRSRQISGIRAEESMFDVKPIFGPIYFLANYSLVPTTTIPPTTEPSTTATPQNVSNDVRQDYGTEESEHHDENMIIPRKKSDLSNMQSDDGGPLSLKNKVEVTYSGASSLLRLNVGLPLLISLLTVVNKIT
ncbi:protein unzipped isoform X1 [Bombus terrestris]|uniref:Protein unzipped isoform X1 n=2 Tax=Bombus terrestris TaxID=30195 RepID=A0A9B2JZD2_BOMTE|nr:protein unzipped isoform X1 [Bombus terrestris]